MKKTTTDKLIETLAGNKEKFQKTNLVAVYEKLNKLGISVKTEYSLPPKDTIGKNFYDQVHFSKTN